jgi:hypothetical protein
MQKGYFMKKNLIILVLLYLFYGCSPLKFIKPCISINPQEDIFTTIIPVNEGNKWVYRYTQNKVNKKVTYSIEGLKEIFYNDSTGKKTLKAYKIIVENDIKDNYDNQSQNYYLKCDDAVQMITLNNDRLIKSIFITPEQPQIVNDSIYNTISSNVWKYPVTVTVPAGTFKCYVRKNPTSEMFFCQGVGMVKVINSETEFYPKSVYELESYIVK